MARYLFVASSSSSASRAVSALSPAFCTFSTFWKSRLAPVAREEIGKLVPRNKADLVEEILLPLPVRLIYNDPNRTFGGNLDDANNRLRHYLEVFDRETQRTAVAPDATVDADCCCAR